jgi:hypothetical protein
MHGSLNVKFSTCLRSSICFISKFALQLAVFNLYCEKVYITVTLAFKTGKIVQVRDEWKNESTNDKKYIESSMLFHCV